MKSIVILGSTGSIGTQCLDVIRQHKDRFRVLGLAAGTNGRLLAKQVEEFRPQVCGLVEAKEPLPLPANWDGGFLSGPDVLSTLATLPGADMVVVATVGATGLDPTLQAIASGKDIAIANKEVLVMAGELAIAEARK
nr:1-deoxy-D-xylulose-5-phosphate reductoisomerase [bacterium]